MSDYPERNSFEDDSLPTSTDAAEVGDQASTLTDERQSFIETVRVVEVNQPSGLLHGEEHPRPVAVYGASRSRSHKPAQPLTDGDGGKGQSDDRGQSGAGGESYHLQLLATLAVDGETVPAYFGHDATTSIIDFSFSDAIKVAQRQGTEVVNALIRDEVVGGRYYVVGDRLPTHVLVYLASSLRTTSLGNILEPPR